jgi:hypothetical protein
LAQEPLSQWFLGSAAITGWDPSQESSLFAAPIILPSFVLLCSAPLPEHFYYLFFPAAVHCSIFEHFVVLTGVSVPRVQET